MKSKLDCWGKHFLVAPSVLALALSAHPSIANDLVEALKAGTTAGDFRLRYENVEQDNPLEDAGALTLRSRLTYTSGTIEGLSVLLEMEDVRVVGGVDDYTVGPTSFNPGEYSVIADPETTELDQAFVHYKHDALTIKGGRQVITYHDHRFVGHVGWRQDRQTFDALSTSFKPGEDWTFNYSYVAQRNRIFAEAADLDSKDHLLNGSLQTGLGELIAYAYLLEVDDGNNNALDTYGLSFGGGGTGSDSLKFLYELEFATQTSEAGAADFDADYLFAEAGVALPFATFKLGYEVLGSDDAAYGFATPLATLHKFNGWADMFLATPAQGLVDSYLSIGGKAGEGSWTVVYHEFSADEETPGIDDFGEELDLQFVWPFSKNLSTGIKYAAYQAGDAASGLVDTDKLWVWTSLSF